MCIKHPVTLVKSRLFIQINQCQASECTLVLCFTENFGPLASQLVFTSKQKHLTLHKLSTQQRPKSIKEKGPNRSGQKVPARQKALAYFPH